MKIIIFTSNALRHKFLANTISDFANDTLVISECRENDQINKSYGENELIISHFNNRYITEKKKFYGNDEFRAKCIPILYKEVNSEFIYQKIQSFDPDAMIVFGASIIKEPILSLGKKNKFINLHLGLSPYYKGNGTNFWPFINNELEFLGSTIMHLDSGIDTGDIITHVRPKIEDDDDVHSLGCKIIKDSAETIIEILKRIKNNQEINRIPQWTIQNERIYKLKDFNEEILKQYFDKMKKNIVKEFSKKKKKEFRIIETIYS
tara:strand:+ start:5661 stop:6449 length:789 start_codon:yes stop_codon:yes gene_type:complete